ncbi:uncharacterized protein UV8b_06871 [Ustilaginoidea virens]|uniref:Uncharacterized protein n=1 Tax=Ustilaginoidea virens TaxID=1159556 RepID=A0A8E5HVY4_USTVR|nr:uncharacterized protein UV8b_06871 [Ustilaginoidea virens]QUC22630.1 hypothetical protein UV8b_06871 [Ustilaginoidea virens]
MKSQSPLPCAFGPDSSPRTVLPLGFIPGAEMPNAKYASRWVFASKDQDAVHSSILGFASARGSLKIYGETTKFPLQFLELTIPWTGTSDKQARRVLVTNILESGTHERCQYPLEKSFGEIPAYCTSLSPPYRPFNIGLYSSEWPNRTRA